jgi:hypothetical protein
MNRKVVIGILLFLSLLFAGVIVYGQIKIRQIEKARQEARVGEEIEQVGEAVPILEPLSSKIEVVSDIPGFTIQKADMSKFEEYLKEWGVFGENRVWLRGMNQGLTSIKFISPEKIILHLTNQEQAYNKVFMEGGEELFESVGENWNEKEETLDLFLYLHPSLYSKTEGEEIPEQEIMTLFNDQFNTLVFISLYDRSHFLPEMKMYEAIEGYIRVLSTNNKLPFKVERKI